MEMLSATVNALAHSPIPTLPECLSLLDTYANNAGLSHHVHQVGLVAYLMAELCRDAGHFIDPILAHRGGLLHDLDKLLCLNSNLDHGQEANRILQDKGYSHLGRIAHRHPAFTLLEPDKSPATLEEKIVYIADKLVEGDQIVGLKGKTCKLEEPIS